MNWLYIAAGVLLLFFGKKAFWMFVAIVGFVVGMEFAPQILSGQTESVYLTVSIIVGLLGALLAVLLQKFAVGLAGLVAGGYITYTLMQMAVLDVGQYQWMVILAGALIGAVLAGTMFDWAMVLITSASGAVLIYQGLNFNYPYSFIFIAVLTILGIIVQGRIKAQS